MQTKKSRVASGPLLPQPLSLPLKLVPASIQHRVMLAVLNRALEHDLGEGELDFMMDRSVVIEVNDMGLRYCLALEGDRLVEAGVRETADLTVRASLYDFMSLVSREQDPDTLVFQRRLVMEGDTELGLALKNYIDGMDVTSSPVLNTIESLCRKALPLYQRVFSRERAARNSADGTAVSDVARYR